MCQEIIFFCTNNDIRDIFNAPHATLQLLIGYRIRHSATTNQYNNFSLVQITTININRV